MSKTCKNLYIIGIACSIIVFILSILLLIKIDNSFFEELHNICDRFDFLNDYYHNTYLCIADLILIIMILTINKPLKAIAITIIVVSILSSNLFAFVASIIYLVQTKVKRVDNSNQYSEEVIKESFDLEKEKKVIINANEENNQDEKIVDLNKIVIPVKQKRKQIKLLDVRKTDVLLLTLGIITGVVIIVLYLLLLIFNEKSIYNALALKMSAAEAFYLFLFVFAYAIIVVAILLIPAVYIFISILFTILLIATRRKFFAKTLSVMGFVTLTIFNGIASVRLLKRFEKDDK